MCKGRKRKNFLCLFLLYLLFLLYIAASSSPASTLFCQNFDKTLLTLNFFISSLSMIFRVNVVLNRLNRTVAFDSD